ncbi:MAG: amidohydrolase family protein [Myxococcota bacterium]|nr:amidohydrolase [Deltaproteobacteria bacterium]MCP4239023.1 amidohydrolase [bacterium]MDP6074015.1 amidohydrolase family protein [Myxococcota bacterium]MDP7075573.1 amidohydrolase family protein [Myxococcota bacterium]MDP7300481.1 amidohydrolase family protein [Myxococcota bacterium]
MASTIDYPFISTDDHIIEPPDLWTDRLESKFKDAMPHVVEDGDAEFWEFEGRRIPNIGLSVMAGRKYEDYSPKAVRFSDMRPGCYDPKKRLEDMDSDGVEASVLFATVPGMAGTMFAQAQDKQLALSCLRAYNDWLADTWCAANPQRLIGQAIVPLWDIDLAVAEFERSMKLGHKALSFPNAPESLNLPGLADPHWDPLWSAVEAAEVPVSVHIASGALAGTLPLEPAVGAPAEVFITIAPSTNFTTVATLMWSGVLQEHPKLRFLSVEGGIGWLAYLVQRADQTWEKHRHWTNPKISEKPSFYFKRQIFANFLDDPAGLTCRHHIGVENILFETDYPHSDTTFPRSKELVAERFKDIPADETRKIVRDNAIRLFGLGL